MKLSGHGNEITRLAKSSQVLQEAQLSQRDRATLRIIEYFAKSLRRSLKVI